MRWLDASEHAMRSAQHHGHGDPEWHQEWLMSRMATARLIRKMGRCEEAVALMEEALKVGGIGADVPAASKPALGHGHRGVLARAGQNLL